MIARPIPLMPSARKQKVFFALFFFQRHSRARITFNGVVPADYLKKSYDNHAYGYTPLTVSSCVRLHSGCLDLTISFTFRLLGVASANLDFHLSFENRMA